MGTIKALVEHKKYSAITEYANVLHGKDNLIVSEYGGANVRLYKDNDKVRILCPKKIDTVQEGYLANAIANGSVFDDADEIDRNASVIERTTLPYDAMVNGGKEPPTNLKPMIAIVVGRMGDDGSFGVPDADRMNGVNFVKDATAANANGEKVNRVVDNYLEKDDGGFYTPEIGKNISGLNKELDDVNSTDPGDVVTDDDTVDSYDGYDMDAFERDPDTADDNEPADDSDAGDSEDASSPDENNDEEDQLDVDNGEEEANNDEEGEPGEVPDGDEPEDDEDYEEGEDLDSDNPYEVDECGNCIPNNKAVVQEEDEYVEESLKVSREDMKGEFMKKSPDGTYHSGSKKPKEKKPALKITGDKISAKSEDLKNAMTGDFIRCVDKDGKIKMIKVTVGKSLIDKNDNVIINITEDSARITVAPENNKSEEKKAPTKKKVIKKTPFGPIATWVYEYANGEVFDEAVFVQEEDGEAAEAAEAEQMGEDVGEAEAVEEEDRITENERTEVEEAATFDQNIKGATETNTMTPTPVPMSAETKSILNNQTHHQEGFFSKQPKKLKPIGRDVVAYITCEMNDIHSSNDQAMLAGYTCSKIELVDWYITVLDTQDPKYIVPHTRQYLITMKAQLESLLTQILKIRPINRSEQIWRVNYPMA